MVDVCPKGWRGGGHLAEKDCKVAVVSSGQQTPHQCAGAMGHTAGTGALCILSDGEACLGPFGQYVCCGPGDSPGGHQVGAAASGDNKDVLSVVCRQVGGSAALLCGGCFGVFFF